MVKTMILNCVGVASCAASSIILSPSSFVSAETGTGASRTEDLNASGSPIIAERSVSEREFSRAEAVMTSELISLNADLSWGVPEKDFGWASSYLRANFEVIEPSFYSITGQSSFEDQYGAVSIISANLEKDIPPIFSTRQEVRQTGIFDLTLGEALASDDSHLWGSLEGILQPGSYSLSMAITTSDWTDFTPSVTSYVVSRQIQENDRGPVIGQGNLTITFTAIPEPSSVAIVTSALILGSFLRRRRFLQ